ncbi:MAG TPA: type II toxin-antitoxin system prevent-host-death family antitoxin [Treponemataceae bacterium]|nr:prevent-host-death protein [Treponema sp.]HOF12361.1 type II toxin-antitoxin system prevent-host-death family antitoxin [Treponemataceae bacterium]HOQ93228.1 type II toxin-antitoxin system prevent-host-death family antitoxin [Treponemataceae bacterium]HPM06211.1 type II toxin-antitoxin system prevent-host-death family antitoxin [Treponemataceae bacterium]HPY53172.1 type II toxin-antitoxin system prevent-host-death family antitoxin [Treponemataceae bacterium]
MANIKPVSDLRSYNIVLKDVAVGEPVFLTKNGRGKYALMDIEDYRKTQATLKLFADLAKGEVVAEQGGWIKLEEIEEDLGIK